MQHRLLWRDKTCPACTLLMSRKALKSLSINYYCYHYYCHYHYRHHYCYHYYYYYYYCYYYYCCCYYYCYYHHYCYYCCCYARWLCRVHHLKCHQQSLLVVTEVSLALSLQLFIPWHTARWIAFMIQLAHLLLGLQLHAGMLASNQRRLQSL